MTPAELIEEARDFHVSFTKERHPFRPCFRALVRAQQAFYRDAAQIAEASVAVDAVFDAAEIDTALDGTPIELAAFLKILNAVVAVEEGLFPVTVYDDERAAPLARFHARLSGRSLYLTQPEDLLDQLPDSQRLALRDASPFLDAYALRVTYVPMPEMPEEVPDEDEGIQAPDEARAYLVGGLVEFLVRRSSGVTGTERAELLTEATAMKAQVLEFYAGRAANETPWSVSRT